MTFDSPTTFAEGADQMRNINYAFERLLRRNQLVRAAWQTAKYAGATDEEAYRTVVVALAEQNEKLLATEVARVEREQTKIISIPTHPAWAENPFQGMLDAFIRSKITENFPDAAASPTTGPADATEPIVVEAKE